MEGYLLDTKSTGVAYTCGQKLEHRSKQMEGSLAGERVK
jgi:hypothetical protein